MTRLRPAGYGGRAPSPVPRSDVSAFPVSPFPLSAFRGFRFPPLSAFPPSPFAVRWRPAVRDD
jgi:hypothetical protein